MLFIDAFIFFTHCVAYDVVKWSISTTAGFSAPYSARYDLTDKAFGCEEVEVIQTHLKDFFH